MYLFIRTISHFRSIRILSKLILAMIPTILLQELTYLRLQFVLLVLSFNHFKGD